MRYDLETEGDAGEEIELYVTLADGTELPKNVILAEPVITDGTISMMLVNNPDGDGAYHDYELLIRVKSAFDFSFTDTAEFTLNRPADDAVVNVELASNTYAIASEGSIAVDYGVISLGGAAKDPALVWTFEATSGIAVQGLTQNMTTDAQSGVLSIDMKNRTSTTGTITITATSVDNGYRSDSVTISVQGISSDVYSYDELYQAVLAAEDGDVISIMADLTAKKVVQVDGTSAASITSASRSLQSTITLRRDIIIEGNGHTIDGLGYYAIFYGVSGTTTIRNLTITNTYNYNTGRNERNGVAVCLKGGRAVLENVTLFENECSVGAGGGIYLDGGGSATLKNCTIVNNKAVNGGGIYVANGTLVIENSIITANRADTNGDNLYYTSATQDVESMDGGYNIIYDIYKYGSNSSDRKDVTDDFDYNENGTTMNKNSIDTYSYEWLSTKLGANGGGAMTVALLYHEDSPAIGRIPEGLYPEYDQRGIKRTGLGDIGAYEYFSIQESFTMEIDETLLVDDYHKGDDNAMLLLDSIATWSSSDRTIATVDSGYITSRKEGTAVIRGYDGSGSEVVTISVFIGDQSISGVEVELDKATADSGDAVNLSYLVSAGAGTDKSLVIVAQRFIKDAWVQLSDLPEGVEVIGLTNTSDASGTLPLTIINQSDEDVVIRITATYVADGSIAGTADITVKKETVGDISLTAAPDTVTSGQGVKISYVFDASPSYAAELAWSVEGQGVALPVMPEADSFSGEITLYPVTTANEAGTLTITLTDAASGATKSVTIDVEPVFAVDAVTSASIVNIDQLSAESPFAYETDVVSYFALTGDIAQDYTWEIRQCDPDDHDDEYDVTIPVMYSVDGAAAVAYTGMFTTDSETGSIAIYVPDQYKEDLMLVLVGQSVAIPGDLPEDEPTYVRTGYHYQFKAEDLIAVTGVSVRGTLSLTAGNSSVLTATVLPADAENPTVTWSSDKTSVATVDANGKVTAVSAGTAVITVTTVDGDFTAACTVTVTAGGNTGGLGTGGTGTGTDTTDPTDPTDPGTDITDPDTPREGLLPFTDVEEDDWFYSGVKYVFEHELFKGTTDTTFAPNETMTRAMMATVLHRMAGSPAPGAHAFDDVPENEWYTDGVNWAAEAGVVKGIGGGLFDPDREITRQEMALMLYNYANVMDIQLTATREAPAFPDGGDIADWAADAVTAMYMAEVLNGKGGGLFDPLGDATRGEVATMFMNFMEATGQAGE